jgi:hypothetical protein
MPRLLIEANTWLREYFRREPAYIVGYDLVTCFRSIRAVILTALVLGTNSLAILADVTSFPTPFIAAVLSQMQAKGLWSAAQVAAITKALRETPDDWQCLNDDLHDLTVPLDSLYFRLDTAGAVSLPGITTCKLLQAIEGKLLIGLEGFVSNRKDQRISYLKITRKAEAPIRPQRRNGSLHYPSLFEFARRSHTDTVLSKLGAYLTGASKTNLDFIYGFVNLIAEAISE